MVPRTITIPRGISEDMNKCSVPRYGTDYSSRVYTAYILYIARARSSSARAPVHTISIVYEYTVALVISHLTGGSKSVTYNAVSCMLCISYKDHTVVRLFILLCKLRSANFFAASLSFSTHWPLWEIHDVSDIL